MHTTDTTGFPVPRTPSIDAAPRSGRVLLAQYSEFERSRHKLAGFRTVLSIDDQRFDSDVLRAMLHLCLGREVDVRVATSLGSAMDAVRQLKPDLIFLDDYLGRTSSAPESIGNIRRWGYTGPIVIVSAMLSSKRRRELSDLGAAAALHKDDLNSMELTELLLSLDPRA